MYISGQLFQSQCKWNLDNRYPIRKWTSYFQIRTGDTVFLKTDDIRAFIASNVPVKVVLVVHNTDSPFTDQLYRAVERYVHKVYAVNCVSQYATPIPLGFRDHQYTSHHVLKMVASEPDRPRTIQCLVNFLIATNPFERQAAYDHFKDKPFCTVQDYATYDFSKSLSHSNAETMQRRVDFYRCLRSTKFAICPAGTGLDTHRVYECILMGCIPIVKTSPLDKMYSDFPIWIVNEWSDVTEETMNACTIRPDPHRVITTAFNS